MFNPSSQSPKLQSLKSSSDDKFGMASEVVAEALGRRPIVIIGDVGVGKTSFIRHLIFVKATDEIKNAIFIYIDLGSQANLGQDLRTFFLEEIERQLFEDHGVDLYENKTVRGIYHKDLQRFDTGIYASLKESAPDKFIEYQIQFLEALTKNKVEHLRRSIEHFSRGRKKQVIISIDNADQRKLADQQDAFMAAQDFAANWQALVLVSLRPQTYFASKFSGSISGYSQRIITISPPRVDLVLIKRLKFSLDLAEGKCQLDRLEGISIKLDSIALFLKALLFSLQNNKEITRLLSNITGGNIRQALDLIKGFIGSANVDSEKIINLMETNGKYMIPLHEFTKQALLGEYSHYHAPSSLALNLFDVRYPDQKEHFLSSMIISYLISDGQHKSPDGFIRTANLLSEMQEYGFVSDQIEHALRRLTNKKLVETTERITFDEGLQGLVGDMPLAFRVTTIGVYHIQYWASSFAYIDAVLFDTPIFDEKYRKIILANLESFDIRERYDRTVQFCEYLNECWAKISKSPVYFDWPTLRNLGAQSFAAVEAVIIVKP